MTFPLVTVNFIMDHKHYTFSFNKMFVFCNYIGHNRFDGNLSSILYDQVFLARYIRLNFSLSFCK